MEDKGWISLHRKILENPLFTERREFSKFEAWIDILLNVNHKEADVIIKNEVIKCGRGQSLLSYESWGKRWNWSKSRVSRYLNFIQDMNMIRIENVKKTTRLTVCNYDSYQDSRNTGETQAKRKRNANETQVKPNNNDNNNNNENNDNNENNISSVIVADAPKKTKKIDFDFKGTFLNLGVEESVLNDWLIVRDKKDGVNSKTAFNGFLREVEKAKISFNEAVTVCAERSWITFTAEYYFNLKNSNKNGKQQNTNNAKESVAELGRLADQILANAGQNNSTNNIF